MRKKSIAIFAAVAAIIIAGIVYSEGRGGVPLRIAFTSNTYGFMEPIELDEGTAGGFARRATAIKQLGGPNTFVVDTGDFAAFKAGLGTEQYRLQITKYTLKGMQDTGIDVCNIGFGDQVLGKKTLQDLAASVSFPLVSASVLDAETGEYAFKPFVVLEKGGVKVAFVGIVDDEGVEIVRNMKQTAPTMTLPPEIRAEIDILKEVGDGFRLLPAGEAIARVTPLLKGKADIVVLLDSGGLSAWEVLKPYSDAKTYAMALASTNVPQPKPTMEGKVPIFINGESGAFVGVIDFSYRGKGSVKLTDWRTVTLDKTVSDDPKGRDLSREMRKSLLQHDLSSLVRKVPSNKAATYVGSIACGKCHRHMQEYDIWSKSPHANSLESLKKVDAQNDPRCLACHTTGLTFLDGYVDEKTTPEMARVSCESCHDPGSLHVETGGRGPQGDGRIIVPGPPKCVTCHDKKNSPNFDYRAYWAKMRHGRGQSPAVDSTGAQAAAAAPVGDAK